jgi:hypothetical protein
MFLEGVMKWKDLIACEMEEAYSVTENLLKLVKEEDLDWKPATGNNWMTTAQLLKHITESCGLCFKGFVTNDWGMPEGMDPADVSVEAMLPAAEKMPAVESVMEAKKLLADDRILARNMLESVTEDDLENRKAPAPWDQSDISLGHRLLQMVTHLNSHKHQLFYYLKLQGKPVHTGHLWGA